MCNRCGYLIGAGYPVVQVRTAIIIKRDGEEIDRKFHRHVLAPDADLSNEDADVVAIASTVFTSKIMRCWETISHWKVQTMQTPEES